MAKWRVDIVPHDTNANKADPQRGVETLRDVWHWGLVRLPGRGDSVQRSPAAHAPGGWPGPSWSRRSPITPVGPLATV
jgi:hypothetical protein